MRLRPQCAPARRSAGFGISVLEPRRPQLCQWLWHCPFCPPRRHRGCSGNCHLCCYYIFIANPSLSLTPSSSPTHLHRHLHASTLSITWSLSAHPADRPWLTRRASGSPRWQHAAQLCSGSLAEWLQARQLGCWRWRYARTAARPLPSRNGYSEEGDFNSELLLSPPRCDSFAIQTVCLRLPEASGAVPGYSRPGQPECGVMLAAHTAWAAFACVAPFHAFPVCSVRCCRAVLRSTAFAVVAGSLAMMCSSFFVRSRWRFNYGTAALELGERSALP